MQPSTTPSMIPNLQIPTQNDIKFSELRISEDKMSDTSRQTLETQTKTHQDRVDATLKPSRGVPMIFYHQKVRYAIH